MEFKEIAQNVRVGPEILVDAYSEGDTYTSPEILGLGRSMAIAEEGYVVQSLMKGIGNRITLGALTADAPTESVRKLGLHPDVVFLPIDFMTAIMMSRLQEISLTRKENEELLTIDNIGSIPVCLVKRLCSIQRSGFCGRETTNPHNIPRMTHCPRGNWYW
jgi:hypothetical protein